MPLTDEYSRLRRNILRRGSLFERLRWVYVMFVLLLSSVLNLLEQELHNQTLLNPAGLVTLTGLIVVAWLPHIGTGVLAVGMLQAMLGTAQSPSVIAVPASALMLTIFGSRWRIPLLIGMGSLFVVELFITNTDVLQDISKTLIALGLTATAVLFGEALRYAARTVANLEQQIATAEGTDTVRSGEREALADELTRLLESDLSQPPPPLASSDDPSELRAALHDAVRRARHSLHNLRMLVTTLRGQEPVPAAESTDLAAALESAEDLLVGHGFTVEIAADSMPPIPKEHTDAAAKVVNEIASFFLKQAPPGSVLRLGMSLDGHDVVVEASCEITATEHEQAGLRASLEQVEALGGSGETVVSEGRYLITARLPLIPSHIFSEQEGLAEPWSWKALTWFRGRRRVIATVGLAGLMLLQTIRAIAASLTPVDETPMVFVLGVISTFIGMVFIWAGRIGSVLTVIYMLLMLVLKYSFQADAWLLMTYIGASALRFRGWKLLTATVGILIYIVLRASTMAQPFLEAFALLELALPVLAFVLISLTVEVVGQSKQQELERLSATQREVRRAERRALASELHDVLAHHLSLIVIDSRQEMESDDPERLRATLKRVAEHNHAALVDMQLLTALLRDENHAEEDNPAMLDPVRTAVGLEDAIVAHGFDCSLNADLHSDVLDATARRTLTRVLREAVTNALRYAEAGSTIMMRLFIALDAANVIVVNRLPAREVEDRSGLSTGNGLQGLAERVELTGGEFAYGPAEGHWVVHARVPLSNEHPALR